MEKPAKYLLIIGAACIILSFIFTWGNRFLRFLGVSFKPGQLPGDIVIKRENFVFYFPLTSGIIFSLLLSALFWLFSHFRR